MVGWHLNGTDWIYGCYMQQIGKLIATTDCIGQAGNECFNYFLAALICWYGAQVNIITKLWVWACGFARCNQGKIIAEYRSGIGSEFIYWNLLYLQSEWSTELGVIAYRQWMEIKTHIQIKWDLIYNIPERICTRSYF